jgi:hypothetical protein
MPLRWGVVFDKKVAQGEDVFDKKVAQGEDVFDKKSEPHTSKGKTSKSTLLLRKCHLGEKSLCSPSR